MNWEPASVAARSVLPPSTEGGLFHLWLDVLPAIASGFHVPGQYHRVQVVGVGDTTLAIASAPGAARFEYLVREGGPVIRPGHRVTHALAQLEAGSLVRVSPVTGKGFPLELAAGHDLLLVGTGTGVAPLRSVIEVLRRRRADYGRVRLVYGVRQPAHLAWVAEHPAWASEGIEVVTTVTAPGAGWDGHVGRVQAHLGELRAAQTFAFLCGQPEMAHDVTAMLVARGVARDRIFLNH